MSVSLQTKALLFNENKKKTNIYSVSTISSWELINHCCVTVSVKGTVFNLYQLWYQSDTDSLCLCLLKHQLHLRVCQGKIPVCAVISPLVFVFARVADSAVFAVIFVVHKQWGCRHFTPLEHLVLGLAVSWGVHVLHICCWVTVQGIRDEAKISFIILLKAHWYHTWGKDKETQKALNRLYLTQ